MSASTVSSHISSKRYSQARKAERLTRQVLLYMFLLMPFFRPTIINDWPAIAPLKTVFAGWLLLSCLMLAYRFVLRNGRLEPFLVLLSLYLTAAAVATLLGNGLRYDLVVNTAMFIAPALLIAVLRKDEVLPFLVVALLVIGVLVVLELATRALLPGGIYRLDGDARWILEGGSLQSRWCFLLVFFAAAFDYLAKGRLGAAFMGASAVSIVLVLALASATSMVALVAEIVVILFSWSSPVQRFATSRNALLITTVFLVLIVFVRIADYLPYDQIATILGKDLTYSQGSTFTGRTYIWDSVIGSIAESPIIGYGYQQYVATDLWQFYYVHDYGSAHNLWLQIGFTAGVFGIILFASAVVSACSTADKCSNRAYRAVLCGLVLSLMLTSVFENTLNSLLILALSFVASPEASEALSMSVPRGRA